MLILNPLEVRFGSDVWGEVRLVVIDRVASRKVQEWSDFGPHAVFADAPERKVTIRVVRELTGDGLAGPMPGDSDTLGLRTSPNASDANGVSLSVSAVVMDVTYELRGQRSALQTIVLVAVSSSGDVDPVVIQAE